MPKYLRSPVQWYGGKGMMLAKLMPIVPPGGDPYCEPYCGGAWLFFARDPAPSEVLNDLDSSVVNLYRCIQDDASFEELRHRLFWTPYSRSEFVRALSILKDGSASAVDRAWALMVAQNQGFSGRAASPGSWGRKFIPTSGMASNACAWIGRIERMDAYRDRLAGAAVQCADGVETIERWDNPDAVFYVDPPYHPDTRRSHHAYRVEADADHHERLIEVLLRAEGAVVLSGYDHPTYRRLDDAGWVRREFRTSCHAAGRIRISKLRGAGAATREVARVEVVWSNQRAESLSRCSVVANECEV